ncbi:MAG TPA: hypothetical protein VIO84_07740 [Candidatus Dormibacteraeota bacterium]|jgi:hypothetical protein
MAQIIADAEVLEVLPEPAPIETEYQRLEIYDYAIASTLDGQEN